MELPKKKLCTAAYATSIQISLSRMLTEKKNSMKSDDLAFYCSNLFDSEIPSDLENFAQLSKLMKIILQWDQQRILFEQWSDEESWCRTSAVKFGRVCKTRTVNLVAVAESVGCIARSRFHLKADHRIHQPSLSGLNYLGSNQTPF